MCARKREGGQGRPFGQFGRMPGQWTGKKQIFFSASSAKILSQIIPKKLPQIMIPLDNCPPENCHFTLIGDRQVRQLKEMISIYSQAQRNLISVISIGGHNVQKPRKGIYVGKRGNDPCIS